jgi:hypothetical protein
MWVDVAAQETCGMDTPKFDTPGESRVTEGRSFGLGT